MILVGNGMSYRWDILDIILFCVLGFRYFLFFIEVELMINKKQVLFVVLEFWWKICYLIK